MKLGRTVLYIGLWPAGKELLTFGIATRLASHFTIVGHLHWDSEPHAAQPSTTAIKRCSFHFENVDTFTFAESLLRTRRDCQ